MSIYAGGERIAFVSVEANEKDGGHSHVVCTSMAEHTAMASRTVCETTDKMKVQQPATDERQ